MQMAQGGMLQCTMLEKLERGAGEDCLRGDIRVLRTATGSHPGRGAPWTLGAWAYSRPCLAQPSVRELEAAGPPILAAAK